MKPRGSYYNEFDKPAAQWLRNLIKEGHIAPGEVDDRSIEDVQPSDLKGFAQCHFFAGIGIWSHALRASGWDDSKPVWSGSCPCQPFSAAGKGSGFLDERHLWPAMHHLIAECRPAVVFGEQVASKAVEPWVDLVQDDLEGLGYAFGAVPFPAAGVGAPNLRDRLYWVGDSLSKGLEGHAWHGGAARWKRQGRPAPAASLPHGLAHAEQRSGRPQAQAADHRQPQADGPADRLGRRGVSSGGLADAVSLGRHEGRHGDHARHDGAQPCSDGCDDRPGPVNGFWRDADWLHCRDDRWRPVKSGTFALAHGDSSRVVKLRAFGNAINSQAAQAFIGAYLDR